jgi:hypothetical protein
MDNCKTCGKEIPDGLEHCRDCTERHFQINSGKEFAKGFPESAKILEQEKQNLNTYADELRDGAFQKGLIWRRNKLLAIHKARQNGISEKDILRELRIGGITIQKARELMRESAELLGDKQ